MTREQKIFYKITLFDQRPPAFCSMAVPYFTEDIEDFQARWFKLEKDTGRKERFLQSKGGKFVTDYYTKKHDFNIVQRDSCEIYGEKVFIMKNISFLIANGYDFKTRLHVDSVEFNFKWISFKDKFFRIAKYKACGVCEWDKNFCGKSCWRAAQCLANPILENISTTEEIQLNKFKLSHNVECFSEHSFETICYLCTQVFNSKLDVMKNERNYIIKKTDLQFMFEDFTST